MIKSTYKGVDKGQKHAYVIFEWSPRDPAFHPVVCQLEFLHSTFLNISTFLQMFWNLQIFQGYYEECAHPVI